MLSPLELAGFRAHSRTPRFRRLVLETLRDLEGALGSYRYRAHVSVSGGKDSTLAWFLCSKASGTSSITPPLVGVHLDSGGEHPASLPFLREEASVRLGAPLAVYHPHLTYPDLLKLAYGGGGASRGRRVSSASLMRYVIDEPASRAARDLGSDAYVIGLRMEESRGRKMTGLVHGKLHVPAASSDAGDEGGAPLVRIAPLLDWTWRDVWAATVAFGLPMHPAYAERLPGESMEHMRVGVLTDLASSHAPATLSRFAAKDPAAYALLKASVPEAPWPI